MLKKLKSLYNQNDKKQVFSNFVSLSFMNGISFLFPLITIPYLTRVLGPTTFGLVSFVTVFIQYFLIFSNFGFAFSATQQISIFQNNKQKLSDIFSAVISVKLLISFFCAIILVILIFSFEQIRDNYVLYIYTFGIVIGDALIPIWLFQGMEKMKYITIVNVASKLTFTLLIFIFVKNESDYLLVPLLNTYGYLIAGIISLIISFKIFKLKFVFPKFSEIKIQIKESWPIFISTFSMNLYRNANILFLGIFTNFTIVGYYSSAEKVIKGLQSIITPVSDALFPFMSKKFLNEKNTNNIRFLFKLSKYYFTTLTLISLTILFLAKPIATFILGNKYISSIPDIRIMSFVILFGGMNYLLGILGLVNMGYKKKFMIYVAITGIISIINLVFLIYFFKDLGASFSMLFSEILLFTFLIFSLKKINKSE